MQEFARRGLSPGLFIGERWEFLKRRRPQSKMPRRGKNNGGRRSAQTLPPSPRIILPVSFVVIERLDLTSVDKHVRTCNDNDYRE